MQANSLLICTDLDRTLLPNGFAPEHPLARELFRRLCALPEVTLAYVTGRYLRLVEEAITEYQIPRPDFAITDVGTKIYRSTADEWQEQSSWQQQIAADWQGKSPAQLHQLLSGNFGLVLQETEKQNDFKLSYYTPLATESQDLLRWAENRLAQSGVAASLIWSIDEAVETGLLDVLPRSASKLHAIKFMQQSICPTPQLMIFAGDSGNDLQVLASSIPSVLVANADVKLKREAQRLAAENGHSDSLYLAREDSGPLGGNYSAGILQGIKHFAPQFMARLEEGSPL